MHNLHYVVVNATSATEAERQVESELEQWGTEDNYSSIGGSISEDNEVHVSDSRWARWKPQESDTIESISKQAESWLEPDEYYKESFDELLEHVTPTEPHTWFKIKEYCLHMYHKSWTDTIRKGKPFNILDHSFRAWDFDRNGVTNISEDNENEKKYVVIVDMHS